MLLYQKLLPLLIALILILACTVVTVTPSVTDIVSVTASPSVTVTVTVSPVVIVTIVTPTRKPTRTVTPTRKPVVCQVKTGIDEGLLNLRSCPSIDCQILRVVNERDELILIEKSVWSYVRIGKTEGWVYSEFLECEK